MNTAEAFIDVEMTSKTYGEEVKVLDEKNGVVRIWIDEREGLCLAIDTGVHHAGQVLHGLVDVNQLKGLRDGLDGLIKRHG